jgi:hypothetical protein
VLTGVWIEEGGRRGVLASRSSGGIRAAQGRSLWSGQWRAPPGLWWLRSMRGVAVKRAEGSAGYGSRRRREITVVQSLTGGGSW